MVKVVAIVGSPRKNKNNDLLLSHILKGLTTNEEEMHIDKYHAYDLNIKPCIACDGCTRKLGCVFKDDMTEIYQKFNEADIVIIASPLYFNSVSAQLKAIIDRCQAIWSSKYVLKNSMINQNKKRIGYFISTAGMPYSSELFSAAIPVMDLFFKSINCEYVENLFVANVDNQSVNDQNLDEAYAIGQNILKQLKS
ncbi:flavodoxin family protein [Serpentinicella sp. ANB-PHB4]|uniref:flavodoxin family protein n=1 Tax=Serpentinicella sp. ANB-PHB4 TaxID=3074076 RepID=UPI00286193FF|nr:flavodoxin family protein [Serpentinicella sp. ANB-PHB4]MDR5659468.1 flavodoxin family protein [Serpentinicella sp. ANB-PHB4]